jgi:transcriptional regulator with XRE-family HTH domain/Zn-dependent peptidase ImmA (M78 family)
MAGAHGFLRKAHFLGSKIKSLRKRNHLTLEDLSARCMQIDREAAPSVSYLSMIENGKRVPSERLLQVIAGIFQREVSWFFDETLQEETVETTPRTGGIEGIPLEPSFLFSNNLLQTVIPELLSQTGTTGRQFAHLLIRAHQESHQNRFPDLERAAEAIGNKRFPLTVEDLFGMARRLGLRIRWFDHPPFREKSEAQRPLDALVRSFYEAPNVIYLNRQLEPLPGRLKYDIANHIAHRILHDGDGARTPQVAGGDISPRHHDVESPTMEAKDILYAWRDFECSYFASALLGPKTPFRQFLTRYAYSIDVGKKVDLSTTLIMRRMSSVSPYPHWHYFDAYPPGNLRAVYRGNGIPLPWGNMRMVLDPCQHWAVFKMLNTRSARPSAQISVLRNGSDARLYCCQSIRSKDAAGNAHVLCGGIDLAPALRSQGFDADEIIDGIEKSCNRSGGTGHIPPDARSKLESVSKILNIGWVADGAAKEASIICPRSSTCPRDRHCLGRSASRQLPQLDRIRDRLAATSLPP